MCVCVCACVKYKKVQASLSKHKEERNSIIAYKMLIDVKYRFNPLDLIFQSNSISQTKKRLVIKNKEKFLRSNEKLRILRFIYKI